MGGMGSKFSCMGAEMERLSLDLPQAVKMVDMYLFVSVLSFIKVVVKANEPNLLKEFEGHLELTDDWVRYLSKSKLREKEQPER